MCKIMRRTRRSCMCNMGLLFMVYYCVYLAKTQGQDIKSENFLKVFNLQKNVDFVDKSAEFSRHSEQGDWTADADYLAMKTESTTHKGALPPWRPIRVNCTAPAIEQFPQPLIGILARRHGGLILHFLVAIYTCFALAIVCDKYFVPSLFILCEALKLSPNVAGATLMAAGSSAPKLAIAVIGVYIAKDDIDISGVIGSSVFNMMFVLAVCGLCSGVVCQLNWWSMVRDCFFYLLSIIALGVIIINEVISCTESVVLILCYVFYCIALHFNTELERWALSLDLTFKWPIKEQRFSMAIYKNVPESTHTHGNDQQQTSPKRNTSPMSSQQQHQQTPTTNFKINTDYNVTWDSNPANITNTDQLDSVVTQCAAAATTTTMTTTSEKPQPAPGGSIEYYKSLDKTKEARPNTMDSPVAGGLPALIAWYVVYPIRFLCEKTMPYCWLDTHRNRYPFTFIISLMWISFYSYFLVWMITVIGATLIVPDVVMRFTFVAAGISVPAIINSIAVVKRGFGNMAVPNALGSNVLDILVCLGLPWFIQTAIISPGSHVFVLSKGLAYSTLSIFSTIIFLILALRLNGWKLNKRIGIILMAWYLIFIIIAALYELNFFANNNPYECISDF